MKRKEGYYWVKCWKAWPKSRQFWKIAYYDPSTQEGQWTLSQQFRQVYKDDMDFDEIDEKQITR